MRNPLRSQARGDAHRDSDWEEEDVLPLFPKVEELLRKNGKLDHIMLKTQVLEKALREADKYNGYLFVMKQLGKMKTVDEILKMRAGVLYVLQSFESGVDYIKLFKILYFAQREHLVKYGRGVIGDTFHALQHGPVPSFIYKSLQMIKGRIEKEADFMPFCKGVYVSNDSLVYSKALPDMDELSESDVICLDKSIKKYRNSDSYRLSGRSHDAAWKEAYYRSLDDPEKDRMTLIDIARAGNAAPEMIEYIKENIYIDKLLN